MSIPLVRGLAALTLFLAPQALAQDAEELFFEAYYLEHEAGELERAYDLYSRVVKSRKVGKELRADAEERAAGIAEELAAADFSRLVPGDTILFAHMDRPGEQVQKLLDQLGLLRKAHEVALDRVAVSPALIDYVLGLRGAALAVVELGLFDPKSRIRVPFRSECDRCDGNEGKRYRHNGSAKVTRHADLLGNVRVDAPGQFCESCHRYTGVRLDCFGCHAAVPPADVGG